MSGWIKLHRKLSKNQLWTLEPFTRGQAWVDLILLANFEKGYILVRGIKIDIERGQVGWSELKLSERWKWSRSRVRTFFKLLESEQQIVQQKNKLSSIISIINYDEYQKQDNKSDNNKTTDDTTEGQQTDTKKKNKEKPKKKKELFIKPTVKEIADYCLERNFGSVVNPDYFINHYDANGWAVGKTNKPMANWKLSVNTWFNNSIKRDPSLKPKPLKESIVICLDSKTWINSEYQAGGLYKTSDINYINFVPDFIDDDEREEVEFNTKKFISEYCGER